MAAYAVACFIGLQLLDVVSEPLAIPVAWVRGAMLLMLGLAPVVVLITLLRERDREQGLETGDTAGDNSVVYRMGDATLDTARREIRFSGSPAEVQPKVFDLLEYLVRNRERVISKDELFDQIWPSVVVTEASLTQSIKRARDLFRRNGFDGDVIRTVPRKGYQFDLEVAPGKRTIETDSNTLRDVVLPTAGVTTSRSV